MQSWRSWRDAAHCRECGPGEKTDKQADRLDKGSVTLCPRCGVTKVVGSKCSSSSALDGSGDSSASDRPPRSLCFLHIISC